MRGRYPTQGQLQLPLVDVLTQTGPIRAREVYPALAEAVGLSPAVLEDVDDRGVSTWARHVRWVEQRTRRNGLTAAPAHWWSATAKGREWLRFAEPGTVQVVLSAPDGQILWADAYEALGMIEENSVDLVLTSPPYLLREAKDYGGPRTEREYIDWLLPIAREIRRVLAHTGSFVLNVAPGPYVAGRPVRSTYVHRLVLDLVDDAGFYLAGEHVLTKKAPVPGPAEWVTKRRVAVTDGYELAFVFTTRDQGFKADNRRVLRPYSQDQLRLMARGGQSRRRRPSGHELTGGFLRDNGGSIPTKVLPMENNASNTAWLTAVKGRGLRVHPCRFPPSLPDWFIRFLTEPGDLVVDPFAGSLTTAAVARRLGRRFIGIEKSMEYIEGGLLRFDPAIAT